MPGGNATVVTFINIVLISILFSLLVFLTGSIFTACGFHFTWNYFQMVIFNTPNSTDRIKTALFKTSYISQDIYLNGGGFGPEGSLLSTVIFAVIIALILIVYGKKLRLNETL
ncbi:MAG: hypothetical protein GYA87_03165, partial [Christensenellaceae bacterium]|nr:hypothetical protein [Christensenellaceae bacterium]